MPHEPGRALLLLCLLLLSGSAPGCIAPDGGGEEATLRHTEFVPAWEPGPANVTFRGRSVEIDANTTYATDGETWFYAAARRAPHEPGAAAACRDDAHQADLEPDGAYVLVSATSCSWAAHPGVSCSGTSVCEDALGVPRRTQPPPPPPPSV